MKHTPKSAAKAVRALLLRTSRIATTWAEYGQQQAHIFNLRPHDRPGDHVWVNAYQAYRLTAEQVHGPGATLTSEQSLAIQQAMQEAMPELFAEYWDQQKSGYFTA